MKIILEVIGKDFPGRKYSISNAMEMLVKDMV